MTTIMDLTSLMCELQNDSNLTDVHIEELKKDIAEQKNKLNTRSSSVDELIKESNRLLLEWEYNSPDPPPAPPPMAFPPPVFAPKRRFVAVDGFKPKILSIESNYEDFLDFRRRFEIYAKTCYEGVPMVDGAPGITYEEWSTLLLTCVEPEWSKRINFDGFFSIEDL